MGLRAVVVADGDVPDRAALDACWPGWAEDVALVIGADGGYVRAQALELEPDLFVGDGDSLEADALTAIRQRGVPLELSSSAKDESDTELAVLAACNRGATSVTVLGALGGPRLDHALANVWLLALPAETIAIELLDATTRIRLLRAPLADGSPAVGDLAGPPGDLVTLLPFSDPAEGIVTSGLLFPLADETLWPGPARGLSNVRIASDAAISLRRGRLLVIETRVRPEEPRPSS